jgi:hypothetical protein
MLAVRSVHGVLIMVLFHAIFFLMSITQTIEIPANRRLHLELEVPVEIPIGKAQISVTPLAETPGTHISLLSLRGSCKGLDTMESYYKRKRTEKEMEIRNDGLETGNV